MLQNIKVDIIYYLTPTDFEMEFNLCGCCRMRLLTDKAQDRKDFVFRLSRAVSRSRVIICCGSLFGEAGLINGVAAAIRKPIVKVDNAAYGIRDGGEINIIEGSMPLVSPEGIFGGCIIESGPQAIIMLSESKTVRKSIMNTLIHPYIEELSISPVRSAQSTSENTPVSQAVPAAVVETLPVADTAPIVDAEPVVDTESIIGAAPVDTVASEEVAGETADEPEITMQDILPAEIFEETSDSAEEPEEILPETVPENSDETSDSEEKSEEKQEEPDLEEVLSMDDLLISTMENDANEHDSAETAVMPDAEPDNLELFIEPQQVKFSKKHYYDVEYNAGADADQFYTESDAPNYLPMFHTPILILTIILIVALAVLAYFLVFIPLNSGYGFAEYFKKIFEVAAVGIKLL